MFSKQRLLPVILAVGTALSLSACAGNVNYLTPYPTPTSSSFKFPEEAVLPPPTFTTTEAFDCWTTPAPEIPPRGGADSRTLVVGYSVTGSSGQISLYRFDLISEKYSLLAANIQEYASVKRPISSDGQHLWYTFNADPADVIFVQDLIGDTSRQVPFPVEARFASLTLEWSPNSQCLLSWYDNTAIAYRTKDGAMPSRTFPNASFSGLIVPSPDGRWWAWDCGKKFPPRGPDERNFCLMSPEGRQVEHEGLHLPTSVDPQSGYYKGSWGQWSPDAHALAITYPEHNWQFQDAVRLVYMEESGVSSVKDIEFKDPARVYSLQWAPNGNRLLMLTMHRTSGDNLDIYNMSDGKITTISNPNGYALVVAPAWSPDGKQIAFVARDNRSLYVMNADGTSITQIPPLPADANGADKIAPDNRVYSVFWLP